MQLFIVFTCALLLAICVATLLVLIGKNVQHAHILLHGPVFVPSTDTAVSRMIQLAQIQPQDTVIDIGSGDGKVVIELAKRGIVAEGVEINPLLVRKATKNLKKQHLDQFGHVSRMNFWDVDFSQYTVVFVYATEKIMPKLEKKLRAELPKGARVISNHFTFPKWKPVKESRDIRVYYQ